ncbi:MAG: ribosome recycling factor [Candidatus Buchananbacteria bacterium]|nr:ribosome recycling factor [Candidatus Buchananbacteria bacterium]
MPTLIDNYKDKFDQAVHHLKDELSLLRVGRANPLMVEGILVDAYGVKTPIKQLASIAVPEARTLLIQPWDKNLSAEVEKAILKANIGINPINEGQQIRLTVPQLTEESRKELTKSVAEKEEKARVVVRQIRDKIKDEILESEKSGDITEDDRYGLLKKLDDIIKDYNEQIKVMAEKKVNEIMTI